MSIEGIAATTQGETAFLEGIQRSLRERTYRAQAVRRVYSPSPMENCGRWAFRRFEKYGLSLHAEKTRLVPFGRPADTTEPPKADGPSAGTFDFLGFTHYWGKSRKGGG